MRIENTNFDVYPKILLAGQESTINICPLFDSCSFDETYKYAVAIFPAEGNSDQTSWIDYERKEIQPICGKLSIPYVFSTEQEYILLIERIENDEIRSVLEFHLYALEEDLFKCYPFKGDLHMHSSYSDGKESPAFIASACRKIGFDFMAITDHRLYAPSIEAINTFRPLDIDLRIYPGEEVHAPDNPVHIINFGGSFSVNDLFKHDSYKTEIETLKESITDLPDNVDGYTYASCLWCYEKIREGGGLGLFCHPYWFTRHRYDVPSCLTDLIFERQPYDAYELLGGYHQHESESNILQVARYNEERAKGKQIPIVGVSDSHGYIDANLFGWFYTIVFAHSSDLEDIKTGIMNLKSVAVEALPQEVIRSYGPFRLVRYSQYLLREIFPAHDELCAEEGCLMQAYLAGDSKAEGLLSARKGSAAALYSHLWGVS